MPRKPIELQIDHHPSGRYTLKVKRDGSRMFQDCVNEDMLFGNQEKGDFLEAVYRKVKALLDSGWEVKLHDFPDDTVGSETKVGD